MEKINLIQLVLPVREGRVVVFHILLPATGWKRGSEEERKNQISREGSRVKRGFFGEA